MASPGGGEAVERSETDEDRRNVSTVNAVRKNGTIFEDWTFLFDCAPCGKLSPFLIRPPSGAPSPPGEGIGPAKLQFVYLRHNYHTIRRNCICLTFIHPPIS